MLSINKVNVNQAHVKPAFGSNVMGEFGKQILKSKPLKYVSDRFEYDKFTMSLSSMLVLLYGATIVPRYLNATDKYDKREILTRDFLSITSILFGAAALRKVFSRTFAKTSGMVLIKFPEKYDKVSAPLYKKVWHHIRPNLGMQVIKSKDLEHYYSNIQNFSGGIEGWMKDFVHAQSGSVKKIFSNKHIKKYADAVLGKDISTMTEEQVTNGFINADKKGTSEIKDFYDALSKKDNPLVTSAKTKNSLFDFLSTICLVPLFMVWIERYNEKVTKRLVAQDKAKKAAAQAQQNPTNVQNSNHVEDSSEAKKAFASFAGGEKS